MPYLQVNDKQVQLRLGETRIGVGGQVEVRLPGAPGGAGPLLAIVDLGRDSVAIRRAVPDAVVRVNGVQLGAEPTPLIHGDKIEILEVELYYGDDRKGGSTQFIPSANLPDLARLRAPVPARATAVTGGRVISLVDGREYPVGAVGLVFGRDASCDVVIPSSDVSRRHAEIVAGDSGYVVTDISTNGLFVNGDRVEGMQILGRADILRIGPEEFRFYADSIPVESALARPAPPATDALRASTAAGPSPSATSGTAGPGGAGTPQSLEGPATTGPDVSRGPLRGAIVVLEVVSSGILRGVQYPVTTILAHIGRGEHNDVVIAEESVSDSHAKLQRRDGDWYLTDVGSTNGTYVAGRRITAEERLGHTADLRLGGVKVAFSTVAGEPVTSPRGTTREFSSPVSADAGDRTSAARGWPSKAGEPDTGGNSARGGTARVGGPSNKMAGSTWKRWLWALLAAAAMAGAVVYFLKGQ